MRTLLLPTLIALASVATGCVSDVKPSSGSGAHSFDCSGLGKGWGDCTQQADAKCGANNYTVLSRTGEADKDAGGNSEMKRTMEVSCHRKP